MLRQILIALVLFVSLSACQKSPDKGDAANAPAGETLLIEKWPRSVGQNFGFPK